MVRTPVPRAAVAAESPGPARPGGHLPEVPGEGAGPPVSQRPGPVRRPVRDGCGGEPILARPVGPTVRAAMWCRRNPLIAAAAAMALLFARRRLRGRHLEVARGRPRARPGRGGRRLPDAPAAGPGRRRARLPRPQPDGPRPARRRRGHSSAAGSTASPTSRPRSARRSAGPTCRSDDFERAEKQLREAIELDARSNGPKGRAGLRATNLLATLLDRTGRAGRGRADAPPQPGRLPRVLGPDDPTTLDAAERLGSVLWHLGRLDEAEAVLRKNVDDRGRVFKPDHADTLRSVYLLSRLLRERRRFDEARDLAYRYAHDIQCAAGHQPPRPDRRADQPGGRRARPGPSRRGRALLPPRGRRGRPHPRPPAPDTRAAEANLGRFLGKGAGLALRAPRGRTGSSAGFIHPDHTADAWHGRETHRGKFPLDHCARAIMLELIAQGSRGDEDEHRHKVHGYEGPRGLPKRSPMPRSSSSR